MSSRLPRFIIRRIRNRNPRHARDFHRLHKRIVAGLVSLLLLVTVGGLAEGLTGAAIKSVPTRGLSADATNDLLGGLAGVAVNTLLRTNTNTAQGINPNQAYYQQDSSGRYLTNAAGQYIPCPYIGVPCQATYQQPAAWQQTGYQPLARQTYYYVNQYGNYVPCPNINQPCADEYARAMQVRNNSQPVASSAQTLGQSSQASSAPSQSAYEACRRRAALNPDDASIRCDQPRPSASTRTSAAQIAAPTLSKDQICALNEDYIGSMEDQTIRFIQGKVGTDVDGIWGPNSKEAYAAYCGQNTQSTASGTAQQQETYDACRARAAANPDDASIRCEGLQSASAQSISGSTSASNTSGQPLAAQQNSPSGSSSHATGQKTCTMADVTDTINAQELRSKCTAVSLQALGK